MSGLGQTGVEEHPHRCRWCALRRENEGSHDPLPLKTGDSGGRLKEALVRGRAEFRAAAAVTMFLHSLRMHVIGRYSGAVLALSWR